MRAGTPDGDSAGVPWAGRTLTPTPFAGDDGQPDRALAAALAASPLDPVAVLEALRGARVFVPVVALAGGTDDRTGGDTGADMALPSLRAPDGRTALPVFSGVAALARWDATARPVPVQARRAAVSAVEEGHQLLVLDAAGPGTAVLPRPALWALAQDLPWTPSPRDPQVLAAVERALLAALPPVRAVRCEPGRRAELRVVLVLDAGLDARGLEALVRSASAALAADEVVAERVDSLELAPEAAGAA
ncbi:SseB family protein [Quadrisphaera sp. DSM 44207]|uniref:SseB family protein n=1 Tax=Quadrisphaera sp. DSM 44207 TaxID=1881057 RepID=UPI00088847F7|nr:SseB family protein [Quadrisphaera sp. DSM 44207]SDQ52731.1 SseB protein N-terminal domain-containing protein [Quadrisphaera sp. DSM 44207]